MTKIPQKKKSTKIKLVGLKSNLLFINLSPLDITALTLFYKFSNIYGTSMRRN